MTNTDLTTISGPAGGSMSAAMPKVLVKERKVVIGRRLRAAIDAMVWQGLTRKEAAVASGMAEHSLYVAFRKPHIKAMYLAELDVLRTSERARNFHALVEVRDQKGNAMARVNAVKAIEHISDEMASNPPVSRPAGLAIVVIRADQSAALNTHQRVIDANPLINNTSVRDGSEP